MKRAIAAAGAMILLGSGALAAPAQGRTTLVSLGSDGANGPLGAFLPSISANGAHVAFVTASRLVPEDTNEHSDVYVRDVVSATTTLASVAADGGASDGRADFPSISATGRFVTFASVASNLIDPPRPGFEIYVRDLEAGTTEIVSVGLGGAPSNNESALSSITPDGRYVAFDSLASNLVPGDTNNAYDVFVRDRVAGTTERVNLTTAGAQATGFSGGGPRITPDGRHVVFYTWAALVPEDRNGIQDVYLRDRATSTTERISVSSEEGEANSISYAQSISDDGRYVAFQSIANNLVPADPDGGADALVRDRLVGTTEAVSVTSDGENSGAFLDTRISADGRFVLFQSAEANLGAGGIPGALNVYVHDRVLGLTEIASIGDAGQAQNGWAGFAAMSGDGRAVAFESTSSNLGAVDDDGEEDVYLRDLGPALGIGELHVTSDGTTAYISGWARHAGVPVAQALDPPGDAPAAAGGLGAEITAASLAHRNERGDLRMRIDLADIPSTGAPSDACRVILFACPGGTGGAPGIVYGMAFRAGGTPYEIRAVRSAPEPAFRLYRCDTAPCTEIATLKGGLGTMGDLVVASVPLSALGAGAGTSLAGLHAFTALGEGAAPLVPLDSVALGDPTIPGPRVEVSRGDGTWSPATLTNGAFTATLAHGPDDGEVRVRACLGPTCGPEVTAAL